jgi:hypothetical protein
MQPYCALPIYPLLTCRDLPLQPGAFLVARFLVRNVAHISIAHGRLYHTPWQTDKERPLQMGATMCQYGWTPT